MVTEDDKPQSRHGTLRRYRAGCTCSKCKAANSAKGKRDREKAKAKREAAEREAAKTNVISLRDHLELVRSDHSPAVQPFSVLATLAEALDTVEADDPVTRFHKAKALTFATVLDDPGKSGQWKGISEALAVTLGFLIAAEKPGGSNAVADIMAAIRGT